MMFEIEIQKQIQLFHILQSKIETFCLFQFLSYEFIPLWRERLQQS